MSNERRVMVSDIIRKLQHVSPSFFSSYPVLFAYVYGSYATDTAHSFSDLDIGIYLQPAPGDYVYKIEMALALELDKKLGHVIETDVRALNNLPLTFLGQILTEGILIYSRNEHARVDFEVGIRKRYFDFMPVLQNYNKAYIESIVSK
jgi:uncharacterized protein